MTEESYATLSWNQPPVKFKAERRFRGWCIGSREGLFGFNRYAQTYICLNQGRNLFDPKIFCLNQINFSSKKEINALIYGQRYNLFDPKIFCLNQKNFVLLKQNISLHQKKCFIQIIFLIQSNIFSECSTFDGNPLHRKKFLVPAYKESTILPSQDRRQLCNPS